MDQDGELTLPADEQLGDVDETEVVVAGESKSEEAEDEAGPRRYLSLLERAAAAA